MRKLSVFAISFAVFFALVTPASAADINLFDIEKSWQENWTDKEKEQYGFFLGLQVADAVTTILVLKNGGEEMNPLYGRNPSTGKILAIKTGSNLVIWGLLNYIPKGEKGIALTVLNFATSVVVINNTMVVMGFNF